MTHATQEFTVIDKTLRCALGRVPLHAEPAAAIITMLPEPWRDALVTAFPGLSIVGYLAAPPERRHGFNALLATKLDKDLDAAFLDKARTLFLYARRADLLSAAHGPAPRGLAGFYRANDVACLDPRSYAAAHRLFRRAEGAGLPCAAFVRLPQATICEISQFPDCLFASGLAARITSASSARTVAHLVLSLQSNPATRRIVENAATHAASANDFMVRLRTFYEETEFPAPPITGPNLRPLHDAAQMRETAERLKNCLASRVPEVLRGEEYFYVWCGGERELACQLLPDRPYGWRVGEIRGPHNDRPDRQELSAALRDLASAGVIKRNSIESLLASRSWPEDIDDDDNCTIDSTLGDELLALCVAEREPNQGLRTPC